VPVEEPSTASTADSCTAASEVHGTNGLLDRVPSSCVVERENTVRRVPKVLGGTSRHGFQNDIA